MEFDPTRPYDALPLLPPPKEVETNSVLKQCLSATRALAELKGAGGLIPDQAILINAIPLQEAQASSEIENILTTQDALFRAALDDAKSADPQTKEVLRYRTALRRGFQTVRQRGFSVAILREVCSVLRDDDISFRLAGENVHIGNPRTRKIHYTPPQGGEPVSERLANMEEYLLKEDGNGRTGRILNILYLVHAGLLELPVLYLSHYLIQHKGEYYRLLQKVTEQHAWEEWIVFLLRGVKETANWTTERVHAIRRLLDETIEQVRTELPLVYSKELVELLFHQPYCKISVLVDSGIAKRQTAAEYLRALEEAGILRSEMVGRERIFVNIALMDLLTEGTS